ELYIRGVTDQNGKFETPLSLAKSGQLYVTAVADNFIPALDTVMIREQVGIDNPVSTANQFYLADAYPNPFNSSTRIKFGCKNSGQIKLEIFDIAGRKVTTLADGNFEAGDHVLSWDGHDDYGRTVASGIYLYRLTDNGRVLTKKMILLK
ncbi:MAG: T9SS type A sorting domain-containing protein, partial [candidate division Zixibacteria bacterium]|nr:T9SS type A sorting domain-containing protein [candidate division Zixibacteria bacterium]